MRYNKEKIKTATTTLDEWLTIDYGQTEIICKMLGCKRPQDHKKQQRENMVIRKKFARTFGELNALKGHSKEACREEIRGITARYEKERRCHRTCGDDKIDVRCYCDEHAH